MPEIGFLDDVKIDISNSKSKHLYSMKLKDKVFTLSSYSDDIVYEEDTVMQLLSKSSDRYYVLNVDGIAQTKCLSNQRFITKKVTLDSEGNVLFIKDKYQALEVSHFINKVNKEGHNEITYILSHIHKEDRPDKSIDIDDEFCLLPYMFREDKIGDRVRALSILPKNNDIYFINGMAVKY